MPINPSLLVAAPMLQDYLVDKDTGRPLANGQITLWLDTARYTQYKNWYYQTGTPGNYTYVALDNPLNLSSVGTIQDPNGNDVIPFYYPFDEDDENISQKYFITVYSVDENGDPDVLQFTRDNFPPTSEPSQPTVDNPTFRNYLLNNIYWRNAGDLDVSSETDIVIAPSQHDGFTNGDIRFIKDGTGATDAISFAELDPDTLENDITPEYELQFDCSVAGTGETVKCIQYPISLHITTLANVSATLVFHGQNVAGNVNNTVSLYIYQFTGTGALIQPDPILIKTITLNNTYQKSVIPFIFPDIPVSTLGSGGDDALFLRVQYPLNARCQINHTKPQIYLSDDVPDNNFDTYDQIEPIINSPRTGDIRISMNQFFNFGYLPMNDGVIALSNPSVLSGYTRANADVWPLYKLLWDFASDYDTGSNFNVICQMYTSAGAATNYGASAYADFTANKALRLTKVLGQVLAGTAPISQLINQYNQAITASNSAGDLLITVASTTNFYSGQPITFQTTGSLPGNIVANAVYYITNIVGLTFKVATTYANAIAGTPVVAWASAGSNSTVYGDLTGVNTGEYFHTLTTNEMPAHTHDLVADIGGVGTVDSVNLAIGGFDGTLANGARTRGGNAPHNNMQPMTFMNFYIKM